MSAPHPFPACSRRQFMETMARGALLVGAGAEALAATHPLAYDVERFTRTDPALVGWEEVSRRTCPIPGARRLAVSPGEVVHVAAGHQIVRWSAAGDLPALTLDAPVTCLAFAPDGALLAGTRQRIYTFDTKGAARPLWQSDRPRSWLSGLAVTADGIWIADSGERILWHCDRAGQLRGRLGARQPERNIPGFVVPSPYLDVKLHPDGLLRVNNPGRHRMEAYTVDGDFELAWGQPSAAIAGFCGCCNPIALAVLRDGRIVTAEKGLPRVKVHAADGTFSSVVAGTETFAAQRRQLAASESSVAGGLDVAVDAADRIHLLDRATGEVRMLRARGTA